MDNRCRQPRRVTLPGGLLLLALMTMNTTADSAITPDNPRLSYIGFANVVQTPDGVCGSRPVDVPTVFSVDAPGAVIAFKTDAHAFTVRLTYAPAAAMPAGRQHYQSTGLVLSGDTTLATFTRPGPTGGAVDVPVTLGETALPAVVRILMPYADQVFFRGLELAGAGTLVDWKPEPAPRYVACGDSITQGFCATRPDASYAWRLAALKGWTLYDRGFGSRTAVASDGKHAAALKPDLVTFLIGVNDCLQKVPLTMCRENLSGFLDHFRAGAPTVPVYLITPLSVPGKWAGSELLDQYRQLMREVVAARRDANLHLIEGPSLLAEELKLYADGLHPNDDGFKAMAAALAAVIPDLPATPKEASPK